MALYATEDAIANSHSAGWQLSAYGEHLPWSRELVSLIERIAEERLPDPLTRPRRDARQQAEREQADRARLEAEAGDAEQALRAQPASMTDEQRLDAPRTFGDTYGRHGMRAWNLREHICTSTPNPPPPPRPAATSPTRTTGRRWARRATRRRPSRPMVTWPLGPGRRSR